MMKNIVKSIVASLVLTAGSATADVVVTHTDSFDPETEGFSAHAALGTFSVFPANDGGVLNWTIDTSSGSRRAYRAALTDAQITDPDGWKLTTILKVADAPHPWNNVMIEVDDGVNRWQFDFFASGGVAGIFTPPGPVLLHAIPDIDTAYHTYEFVFIPGSLGGVANPNLNSDDVIEVIVDSVPVAFVSRPQVLGTSAAQTLIFGDTASLSGTAESRWNFVEFETLPAAVTCNECDDAEAAVLAVLCDQPVPASFAAFKAAITTLIEDTVVGPICVGGPGDGSEEACEAAIINAIWNEAACTLWSTVLEP